MAQPISATSPAIVDTPPTAVEKPFTLTPAIFTPFPSLSKDPHPVEQQDRLEAILRNLDRQHGAVRKNMIFLMEQQGKRLVARAQEELDLLEGADDDVDSGWEAPRAGKEELEAMVKRLKAKAGKGEDYEFKTGDYDQKSQEENQDVTMGDMGDIPQRRNAAQVRYTLTRELNELIARGAKEMEGYDQHARKVTAFYKEALERGKRSGKFKSGQGPRGGILKNRNEEIIMDYQVRRMSTGLPVVGLPSQAQSIRTFENAEELARRSSR